MAVGATARRRTDGVRNIVVGPNSGVRRVTSRPTSNGVGSESKRACRVGLVGEPQLFEKRPPAAVALDVFEEYGYFREGFSRSALRVGALEPLVRDVRVAPVCIRFRNLERGTARAPLNELPQRSVRLGCAAARVLNDRQAQQTENAVPDLVDCLQRLVELPPS